MFPRISNINDVLPHIQGLSEFNVVNKGDYVTINYAVDTGETFKIDPENPLPGKIRRECRGIKFDAQTGNIICRPFHKFANLGQWEETLLHNLDLSKIKEVMIKEDGSMIAPFLIGNTVYFGTKAGVTETSVLMARKVSNIKEVTEFSEILLRHSYTPIFEYVGPENKIVLDYKESKLILLAVRDIPTGEYMDIDSFDAKKYGIETVQRLKFTKEDFHNFVNQISKSTNIEGVVVSFESGERIKIKTDEYVAIHKAKEQILSPRNVVQMMLDNTLDDVIAKLDEPDQKKVNDTIHDFITKSKEKRGQVEKLVSKLNKSVDGDKKLLASLYLPKLKDKSLSRYMFEFADKGNIDSTWERHMRSALQQNCKYDEYMNWLEKETA